MNNKAAILSVIKDSGWITGISRIDLAFSLRQYYRMNPAIIDELTNECIQEGLVSIDNDRFKITRLGKAFLDNENRFQYIESAYNTYISTEEIKNKETRKQFWPIVEKLSWIAGIAGLLFVVWTWLSSK